MKLYFLAARVPLTKAFSRLPTGGIDKTAYPLVKNFTSHEETVETPRQFVDALKRHAHVGHCLLKGQLSRPLSHEPRAGSTTPLDPTRWSCFDLDNVKGIATVEEFVTKVLPPEFHDADYILQYSASAGVTPDEGLRAHVFFLHEKDFTPEAAKLLVTELNLENEILSNQLELTAAGTALRFPLDRTVNQNDKLIYIAPPALGDGVEDRLGDAARIQLVEKGRRYVDFSWATRNPPAGVEALVHTKVDELRRKLGLKPKTGRTVALKSGDLLLKNPDTAVVTGEKRGRGFVYLNLNGGDSWGYYYSEDNPRYLNNFKGEPVVILADFLPTYWAQIQGTLQKERKGDKPFVFRHRLTDTIWNGVYDPINDRIKDLAATSRANLPDFFSQFDADVPQIEDWTFEFQPANDKLIDFDTKFCNRFERTEFMRNPGEATEIPPTIRKVLWSVVGNDQECFDRFVNWLACAFKLRVKIGTAWVLHGVQGTGKGILYHQILTPLFGPRHCVSKQIAGVEDRFNADMETCLIFNLDEARVDDSASAKRVVNKLKNMITEPMLEIRAMRSNPIQVPNYTNYIFTSNDYDALSIDPTDRRFNVAPRQESPIQITDAEVEAIAGELRAFAGYLVAYPADLQLARTALNNEAKREMRNASQDAVEQLCQAVVDGNLGYFFQFADTPASQASDLVAWSNYRSTLRRWLDTANQPSAARRGDLLAAYVFLINPSQIPGPQKFHRMLAHKNIQVRPQKCPVTKETVRGVKVTWTATEEEIAEWKQMLEEKTTTNSSLPTNVVPMSKTA